MAGCARIDHLYDGAKGWDERLCKPEAEDKLGTSHEKLGSQSLEEAGHTFVPDHVSNDAEAGLGVLEIAVLDTGLDHIKRSRNDERSSGTGNGSDKVLHPGSRVVVLEAVDVLLGEGRTSEKLQNGQLSE